MRSASRRWRHFRRTRHVAAGVLIAGVLTFAVAPQGSAAEDPGEPDDQALPTAPVDPDFNGGTGSSSASAYKVNPVFGNLSFGITAGQAIAGHQNTQAQAISRAIDMGVIGTSLAGEGCDGGDATMPEEQQPQPLIAESNDPDAADGYEADDEQFITKSARATPDPFAEAITTVLPLGDEAVAEIRGGRAIATSGVVDGNVREARALTEIASVSLLGGQVVLGDMRWEAVHRSGGVEDVFGDFTLGSLTIAGEEQSLPSDEAQQLEELNVLLNPLGFQLVMPRIYEEEGFIFVDPMKIGVIPSENRDLVTGGLLEQLQPFREQLTAALLEMDCGNATYITILDLALGSFSGAGSLNLELGGVRATTGEIDVFQFGELPELPDLADAPVIQLDDPSGSAAELSAPSEPADLGGSSFDGGGSSTPSSPSPEQASTPAAPAEDASSGGGGSQEVAAMPTEPIADLVGARGGWLAAISGLGLALLLVTAEGDRRKMRRALRDIPLEA